jgi:transposase InsO family protein
MTTRTGLRGVTRAKTPRTTRPAPVPEHRPDLVDRVFTADAPNRLWVADITSWVGRRVDLGPPARSARVLVEPLAE